MRLYHKNVFFPYIKDYMLKWFSSNEVLFSKHLKRHLHSHRGRYKYTLEDCINLYRRFCKDPYSVDLFEVGYEGKYLRKICFRDTLANGKDLTLVVSIQRSKIPILVTAWLNKETDTHTTLNVEKYCKSWRSLDDKIKKIS